MSKTPILVGTVVGLLCAVGFFSGIFANGSSRISDQFFLDRAPDSSIVIVAIDDTTLTQVGRWPWPRKIHADVIQRLTAAGASVIGYDVSFPEVSDELNDTALADELRASGRVVLPVELDLAPIALIASAAAATGHSNLSPDPDGIVRRVAPVVSPNIPSFSVQVARLAGLSDRFQGIPLEHGQMRISFAGAPRHTFRTISAVDVLRNTADLSMFKNAIVFVGATAPDLHDAYLVPTSNGTPMPGVEIHASIFDTFLHSPTLAPIYPFTMAGLILLLGVLVGALIPFVSGRWSIPVILGVWVIFLLSSFAAFDRGVILDTIWPTLALFCSFIAVTLERRMHADRRRRELKTAFSRYVSPVVVDSIIQHPQKLKLGGERKNMTVLFSDIRGFTSISEGEPPERLVELLNKYLSRMTKIVFQHEGVLDKYIGDAVMAFWNAPIDHPDHAVRAVRTALEMQRAVAEMNASGVFGTHTIKIGIGINTGEMVVGNIGGDQRFEYTVIGDNVNVASRLEGLTKEYNVPIIVSESTANAVGSLFTCRKLGEVAVKGKTELTTIYGISD